MDSPGIEIERVLLRTKRVPSIEHSLSKVCKWKTLRFKLRVSVRAAQTLFLPCARGLNKSPYYNQHVISFAVKNPGMFSNLILSPIFPMSVSKNP